MTLALIAPTAVGGTNYNETGRAVAITAIVTPTDQADFKDTPLNVAITATVTCTDAPGWLHVWAGANPTAATDSSAYNLGTYFSLVSPVTLGGIRIWNPGLVVPQGSQNRQAYLWTATNTSGAGGVIQRTIDIPDLLPVGWSEHLFSTPYSRTTGVIYCIAYFVDGGATAGQADYGAVTGGLPAPCPTAQSTSMSDGT